MVERSNVRLSNWEGHVLSSVVSKIPYGPLGSSYRPWFRWMYSSTSGYRNGDTDVPNGADCNVAVNCFVLTGCIPDIVMYGKFERYYFLIANKAFLFHNVVDNDCLFELVRVRKSKRMPTTVRSSH